MNTEILEYILSIEEEGSISKAAEKHMLTQPVLSRHLKKLEARYDAQFFRRTPDGVVATGAGIVFLNSAQEVLHEEKLLNEKLAALKKKKEQEYNAKKPKG